MSEENVTIGGLPREIEAAADLTDATLFEAEKGGISYKVAAGVMTEKARAGLAAERGAPIVLHSADSGTPSVELDVDVSLGDYFEVHVFDGEAITLNFLPQAGFVRTVRVKLIKTALTLAAPDLSISVPSGLVFVPLGQAAAMTEATMADILFAEVSAEPSPHALVNIVGWEVL